MTLEMNYQPNPDVIATTLTDQEVVLLHIETHQYYTLNATGAQIWTLLSDQKSVAQISEQLTTKYSLSLAEARGYVVKLLEELAEENLIRAAEVA